MKNLKLAHKMLILSLILMGSMLTVAYVAVNQLSEVDGQVRRLVDGTIQRRDTLTDLQSKLLVSIRNQKNAIIAPDDERSKGFAETSRAILKDVAAVVEKLKEQTSKDGVEGQSAAVEAIAKAIDANQKINDNVLDLAVQNTNLKARLLLKGDFRQQTNVLVKLIRKSAGETASKSNPGAADVARLSSLFEVYGALLGMHPVLVRHINSSSKEEMAAEEKTLSELMDTIQTGLPALSESDPTSQAEGRSAFAELKTSTANLVKLSETDSNNRSIALSLGESVTAGNRVHRANHRPLQASLDRGHDRAGPQRDRLHDRHRLDTRRRAGEPPDRRARRHVRDSIGHQAGPRSPQPYSRWPTATSDGESRSSSATRSVNSPRPPTPWRTPSAAS